ncbi:hypothetical protein [Flagellimonas sediminis]|uniref:Uncharacterized protein n=1 Tax=Flagellimonas sediminis TaxID=2696468 RepID=A0A6I5KRM4_9FLAO|nr:hypothetical protein [Allomuricauda sediminis]NDV43544.1 hypothetical protein [Allomuricauda sediminis]
MKNNRKVALAFLSIFVLFLGACQQGPKKDEPRNSEPPQEEKVSPPEGIISLEESKSLYDNYTKNRVDMIHQYEAERSPDTKFEAARFTSFTYAEIKQYMAYIEQEASMANVEISSLRFYFANYPDKEHFPDGKKIVHPRQNSMFIVPTMKVDGEDYGFYIGADGKAKLIKDAVGTKGMGQNSIDGEKSYASFAPTLFQTGDKSLDLNHGGSGPPPFTDF